MCNFLNIWYIEKKIILHDIHLTKKGGAKGAHEEVLACKITEVSIDTLDEEDEVGSKEGVTKSHEENPTKSLNMKNKISSYVTQRKHMLKSQRNKNQ